jgi:hypothetical protein
MLKNIIFIPSKVLPLYNFYIMALQTSKGFLHLMTGA